MKMVRQREAIHEHNTELQGNPATKDSDNVNLLKSKNTNGSTQGIQSQKRVMSTKKVKSRKVPQGPTQCTRCGKNSHTKAEKCPASTATGHKCNRKGHFASQCFSKTVKATTDEVSLNSSFLDVMTSASQNSWTTKLLLGKTSVNFKLGKSDRSYRRYL